MPVHLVMAVTVLPWVIPLMLAVSTRLPDGAATRLLLTELALDSVTVLTQAVLYMEPDAALLLWMASMAVRAIVYPIFLWAVVRQPKRLSRAPFDNETLDGMDLREVCSLARRATATATERMRSAE